MSNYKSKKKNSKRSHKELAQNLSYFSSVQRKELSNQAARGKKNFIQKQLAKIKNLFQKKENKELSNQTVSVKKNFIQKLFAKIKEFFQKNGRY